MYRIIYLFLLFIAALLVLITSDEPIMPFLAGSPLEKLLTWNLTGKTILFNLSMGILVSAIFYFIVVYLPEAKKRKDIQPHLERHISGVLTRAWSLVPETVKHSKENFYVDSLTKDQFEISCKKVNPKSIQIRFHSNEEGNFEDHYGMSCFNHWSFIENHINEIMRFLPYVDTQLVKILNEIRNSNLSITISELRNIQRYNNSTMEPWAECIYHVYDLARRLEKQYISIANKSYKHPFRLTK
jgi:hypothetical protein